MLSFDIFLHSFNINGNARSPVSNKIPIKQLGNIYSFLCQFLPSIRKNIAIFHVSLSVKNLFSHKEKFLVHFYVNNFSFIVCFHA